jgi:hypothetical protein
MREEEASGFQANTFAERAHAFVAVVHGFRVGDAQASHGFEDARRCVCGALDGEIRFLL